jgi:hypothetical protein
MKFNVKNLKSIQLTLMLICVSFILKAQEKKLDVDINVGKGSSEWYMNPVAWVIGGAVFILILVALLRKK